MADHTGQKVYTYQAPGHPIVKFLVPFIERKISEVPTRSLMRSRNIELTQNGLLELNTQLKAEFDANMTAWAVPTNDGKIIGQ